jgi:hypothetical protein
VRNSAARLADYLSTSLFEGGNISPPVMIPIRGYLKGVCEPIGQVEVNIPLLHKLVGVAGRVGAGVAGLLWSLCRADVAAHVYRGSRAIRNRNLKKLSLVFCVLQ